MLACRRPEGDAWAGWWEFPGGKIEENESQEIALIREIEEELGISVSPISCVAEISHDYGDRDVDLFIWKCEPVDPASIRLSEHDKAVWIRKEGLIDLKWLPADLPLIEEWSSSGIP
jgi:8-oxo-dGTP diphosphatase